MRRFPRSNGRHGLPSLREEDQRPSQVTRRRILHGRAPQSLQEEAGRSRRRLPAPKQAATGEAAGIRGSRRATADTGARTLSAGECDRRTRARRPSAKFATPCDSDTSGPPGRYTATRAFATRVCLRSAAAQHAIRSSANTTGANDRDRVCRCAAYAAGVGGSTAMDGSRRAISCRAARCQFRPVPARLG